MHHINKQTTYLACISFSLQGASTQHSRSYAIIVSLRFIAGLRVYKFHLHLPKMILTVT